MTSNLSEASCPTGNNTTFTTINNQQYLLYCRTDFPGFDLPSTNATSYTSCIEACDNYKLDNLIASGANCVGITFGATNINGDKCYLKFQIEEPKSDGQGKVSARRVQYPVGGGPVYDLFPISSGSATKTVTRGARPTTSTSNTAASATSSSSSATSPSSSSSASSASSSSSSGLSTGGAAGLGVGIGVIVLALIIIAFFIIRRRKRRRQDDHAPGQDRDLHEVGEDNKAYALHEKDNDPRSGPKENHIRSTPAENNERPITPRAEKGTSLDVTRGQDSNRQELAGDEPVRELDGGRV